MFVTNLVCQRRWDTHEAGRRLVVSGVCWDQDWAELHGVEIRDI